MQKSCYICGVFDVAHEFESKTSIQHKNKTKK